MIARVARHLRRSAPVCGAGVALVVAYGVFLLGLGAVLEAAVGRVGP